MKTAVWILILIAAAAAIPAMWMFVTNNNQQHRNMTWRGSVLFVAFFLLVTLLFWEDLFGIARAWNDTASSGSQDISELLSAIKMVVNFTAIIPVIGVIRGKNGAPESATIVGLLLLIGIGFFDFADKLASNSSEFALLPLLHRNTIIFVGLYAFLTTYMAVIVNIALWLLRFGLPRPLPTPTPPTVIPPAPPTPPAPTPPTSVI